MYGTQLELLPGIHPHLARDAVARDPRPGPVDNAGILHREVANSGYDPVDAYRISTVNPSRD